MVNHLWLHDSITMWCWQPEEAYSISGKEAPKFSKKSTLYTVYIYTDMYIHTHIYKLGKPTASVAKRRPNSQKVLSTLTLYSSNTRTLTFQNFRVAGDKFCFKKVKKY